MELRIESDSRAVERMLTTAPTLFREAMQLGMGDATVLVLREISLYPPKRATGSYRRTGTLKRSWFRKVQRTPTGVTGEVVSAGQIAPYNIYVQKAGAQAAVHVGRWQTERRVIEQTMQQVVSFFRQRLQTALLRLRA